MRTNPDHRGYAPCVAERSLETDTGVVLSADAHGWAPTPGQMHLFGKEIPAGLYRKSQSVGDTHRIFLGSGASATAHPRAPLVCFDRSHGGLQRGVRERAA